MASSVWRNRVLCLISLPLVALVAGLLPVHPSAGADQPVGDATAVVETQPVTHTGDAADDPAIWRHPTDSSRSLVIGNDKGGALDVYALDGTRIQQFTGGFFGNVDVRYGVPTATGPVDVAVAYRQGVRVYGIDPATRQLSNITDTTSGSISSPVGGEGLCLYRSAVDSSVYVFVNNRSGGIAQIRLGDGDGDGRIEGTTVRQWDVGTETEGCVADDELGHLYISEEDVAIWKYGAEPTAPTSTASRVAVDRPIAAGGHFRPDVEGLTIVYQPGGTGYLIASSQAASDTLNSYLVFERQGSNAFVREFRIVTGTQTDGCGRTDGIDALAADLGPVFPQGVFICQDNNNTAPAAGAQNFKLVPLERVVALSSDPPPPPPPPPPPGVITFVGQSTSNVNSTTHRVTVPSDVVAGDGLLLFMGTNSSAAVGTPSGLTGWQQLGVVTMNGPTTRVWRKVAAAGDAGRQVQVTVSSISKANVALLAYRGTSVEDPVAAFTGVWDTPARTSHPTPVVATTPGTWAVSYWTHKDSTTALLSPPAGVTVRANGTQSGSGSVKGLVADAGPVAGTSYGGLVATGASSSSAASAWTIVLRSAE